MTRPRPARRPVLSRRTAPLLLLAALAGPAGAQGFGSSGDFKPAIFANCTPRTVSIGGQPTRNARNPIAEALSEAGPGSVIKLAPGDYPAFGIGYGKPSWWNAQTSGGFAGNPVVVQGQGRVRILPGDRGDTISIDQGHPVGHITFRGLTIVPGYRAGVMFTKQSGGRAHRGFHFEDCSIEGSWNHVRHGGGKSKWGVWGHSLDDFQFKGVRGRATVSNLRYEHAFYLQNPVGNVTIENVDASELGRTFVQLTNRKGDGPPGQGLFIVRGCNVRDIGLSRDDNHKGGSAFTFAGRHVGTILVERCTYRAGFAKRLRGLTRPEVPYGTGALVAWDGHEQVRNRQLVLEDNHFEFADGCGDRPVVSIGGCSEVHVTGQNRFLAGANPTALALDPTDGPPGSPPKSVPNGSVYVSEETQVRGAITLRGQELDDEQRADLAIRAERSARRAETTPPGRRTPAER